MPDERLAASAPETEPAADDAVDVIARYQRALAARDRAALKSLLRPDVEVVYHGPAGACPWIGEFRGFEGFERFLEAVAGRFDIVSMERLDTWQCDRQVITRSRGCWRVRDNGNEVRAQMINIFSVDGGAIRRLEFFTDTLAFARAVEGRPPA